MGEKWRMPTAAMSDRDIFEYASYLNLFGESLRVFERAQAENKSTNFVARTIAEERLNE